MIRGSAALAGAAIAPTLLIRRSRAATNAFGSAKHVLVLVARGGLRSHCLFNAVGTAQHNPHGTQPGSEGTEWTPGAVFGSDDITTASFETVPGLHGMTHHVAVLGAVDLEPAAARPLIDHDSAMLRLGTGVEGSGQGLLSRVMRVHPRYQGGIGVDNVPPVEIGNTSFGKSDTREIPLRLPSARATIVRRAIRPDWSTQVREELDRVFAERSPAAYHDRIAALAEAKGNAFDFSAVLVDPRLDILGAPEAEHAGISNAQLIEVLGDGDLLDLGDNTSNRSWGSDVALAIRMLGFGSAMVVVERDIYDTHSREDEVLPVRCADLARQLAGVRFLLSRMDHPDGGTFWDHTVVTVVSEFNRNNTEASTGFNSGNGSDHQLAQAHIMRNQAVPLLGGPIEQAGLGGRLFGTSNAEMEPQGPIVSMRSVYSTLLDLLGAGHEVLWPDPPIVELFA